MGERKVLNKYFPPDFDPSIIPRRKRPKNQQIEVRMMLPFSIQCATCGEYMYRGKKFNSRKEDVVEEDYFGIRIFRFYIKCVTCSSEITFKTDPKNGDYVAEHGCQRNFEPWREKDAEEEAALKQKEDEEKGDAMKVLENRTLDSKREMDILDALDEIKAINQRHSKIDTDALLQQHAQKSTLEQEEQKQKELEEDIRMAKEVFEQRQKRTAAEMTGETDTTQETDGPAVKKPATTVKSFEKTTEDKKPAAPALPNIVVKKKTEAGSKKAAGGKKKAAKKPVVTTLVAQYSDSSSEE
ncbi:hypothetical protein Poli38472_010405 [Pythium oligandrum]|uniref:Splicing factor YJU2 n=1 Tax=Pythium oligandrum TaxID=41045 RepID=A0A8K1C367_PYTOL|nr:hypothetical protein Poli38472_010405 [Pythium oligandrum]|eukprot:TMW55523.1 hypothetical protein Poli38472_010405 [Pythium oligandrum]